MKTYRLTPRLYLDVLRCHVLLWTQANAPGYEADFPVNVDGAPVGTLADTAAYVRSVQS